MALLPCGLSCSGENLSSVRGKVLVDGQPADGAVVVFHPVGEDTLETIRPTAVTDADGNFELPTGDSPGAAPGQYVVTVIWPEEKRDAGKDGLKNVSTERPEPPADRLEGRYADRSKSKFPVEIGEGEIQLEPFKLE